VILNKCKTCGFTWRDGEHGSHDCWEVKDARYEALKSLAQEVLCWHRDRESPDYNDCGTPDTDCMWCASVKELIQEKTK